MSSKLTPLLLISLILALLQKSPFLETADAQHELTVIYGNDVQGEIEPCG